MQEPDIRPLVIIVDDFPEAVMAMQALLEARGYATRAYGAAQHLLAAGVPDNTACLILDLSMPGMDGLTLLEEVRRRGVAAPALVVSGAGDIRTAVRALKLGAADFIEKPYAPQELLSAVAACIGGRTTEGGANRKPIPGLEKLTRREREVFECVTEALANKEIANRLGISPRTVEIHRAQVMSKLGARNLADLLRMVYAASGAPSEPAKEG